MSASEPEMSQPNSGGNPSTSESGGNPVANWIILIAIGLGFLWLCDRNKERQAQRRREIMREINWVVTPDGVRMYKTSPYQNLDQRVKEIDRRYSRPIWEYVPEDRSGKGVIIIKP